MSEYLRSKRIIKAMEQPLHNRQKKRLQRQKENIKPSDSIIKNEGVNKGVKDNFEGVKDPKINGISVIISAYKSAEFIEECLDSVANQKTNIKYEILLGIDGCEETLEKVKSIMSKYNNMDFHVYYSEINVGVYLMFNSLIEKSKYKYFTVFGADDIMLENHLEENIKYLNLYNCVITRGINFENNIDINHGKNHDGIIILNKKDFLEINGYDEYRCGMDSDLLKRLKKENKKIYKCTINTYKRRIHSNSLTQNKETGYNSDYRNNIIKIINNRINTKLESFKCIKIIPIIEDKIIVNFTTYPKRDKYVPLMLNHFKKQTIKPDEIIMWLSREEYKENKLPLYLQECLDNKLVTNIKFIDGNSGPHKRWETFKYNNDAYNIMLDDDIYYNETHIEELYNCAKSNPKCVVSYLSTKLDYIGGTRKFMGFSPLPLFENTFLSGNSCLPPNTFPIESFKYIKYRDLITSNCDDSWISSWLIKNDIKIIGLHDRKVCKHIEGSQECSIWEDNGKILDNNVLNKVRKFARCISFLGINEKVRTIWPNFDIELSIGKDFEYKNYYNILKK